MYYNELIMSSIFTKIVEREIPAHIIYEDDICIAILDIFPMSKGQSMVIPKKEVDYAFDLDEVTYQHIFGIAQKIAKATDKAFSPLRTCLVVEGTHVPHAHIKMYPLYEKGLQPLIEMGPEADHEELRVQLAQLQAALED